MSIRTIIVGILAAFCGICATVGVMTLNNGNANQIQPKKNMILIAKTGIDMGQQVKKNVLDSIEWNSDRLPPGAFTSESDVIDKYCTSSLAAGEVLTAARFADSPTTLLPANGLRAYAIAAVTASSNVGRNLVPGNRVDIIWQTSGKLKGSLDPISVRLLQNVKILAVGQVSSDIDNTQKSITLEVKPKMDENLAFAQAYGKLSLSLRNPGDNEGVEPMENVKFKDLLTELETAAKQPTPPTALEAFQELMSGRLAAIEQALIGKSEETQEPDRETLNRIAKGMRAITIQTPNESTGLAGLLEPGDRVDLQLTIARKLKVGVQFPSETLIENIEVLAVDSNIYSVNGDGEKKMSRSVTLIVMESMIQDIAKASQLGTLSLTLRGFADSETAPPRTVMSVDEFVAKHLPATPTIGIAGPITNVAVSPIKIRTMRGPAVQELPFVTQ